MKTNKSDKGPKATSIKGILAANSFGSKHPICMIFGNDGKCIRCGKSK